MSEIIESNHMDYSSGRVQFMLGITFLTLFCLCLYFVILMQSGNLLRSLLTFLLPSLFINLFASGLIGLLFYEIANRFGNRLQALSGIWACILWFFLSAGGGSSFSFFGPESIFNAALSVVAVLPVFLHLRLVLLEEKQYYWWCWIALLLSLLIGGSASFVFSSSGIVLCAFFLPPKYNSSPVLADSCLTKPKFNYTFLLLATALTVASCFYIPWSNESPISSFILSGDTTSKCAAICLCLLLVRLLLGKIYIGAFLLFLFWLLALSMPFPQILNHKTFVSGVLPTIPITYILVLAALSAFDVLDKKQNLLLSLLGSILLSVICCSQGVVFIDRLKELKQARINSEVLQSQLSEKSGYLVNPPLFFNGSKKAGHNDSSSEISYFRWNESTGKVEKINYSGLSHLVLTSKNFAVSFPQGQKISEVPRDNWIDLTPFHNKPWLEIDSSYLNLFSGSGGKPRKKGEKHITVNGYMQKGELQVFLGSDKINPHQANNVKIKLAFPIQSASGINWIWKGDNNPNLCSAPLELENSEILTLDLKNNVNWQMNNTVENIGISLPGGKLSLAIEKIEL